MLSSPGIRHYQLQSEIHKVNGLLLVIVMLLGAEQASWPLAEISALILFEIKILEVWSQYKQHLLL